MYFWSFEKYFCTFWPDEIRRSRTSTRGAATGLLSPVPEATQVRVHASLVVPRAAWLKKEEAGRAPLAPGLAPEGRQ
jgi:hypothetical protein